MKITACDKEKNAAISPERPPKDGEFARYESDTHIEYKHFYEPTPIDSAALEKAWVVSELLRTDELAKLPDYPHKDQLYAYRKELRDYTYNGDRPIKRLTDKGSEI